LALHGKTDMHLELRNLGGPARFVAAALFSLFVVGFSGPMAPTRPANAAKPTFDKSCSFYENEGDGECVPFIVICDSTGWSR
jgi:hypothetical protein